MELSRLPGFLLRRGIKAAIALYESHGVDPTPIIDQSTRLLFDRFLRTSPAGCWYDMVNERGWSVVGGSPASTLYHLFLAFSEVLRIAD